MPHLTIGFATRNEYAGAWMTLNALFEYHGEAIEQHDAEILIVDNSDKTAHAEQLQGHLSGLLNGKGNTPARIRYIHAPGAESSCLWKQRGIDEARGEFVIWCDGHVLFKRDAISRVMAYFQEHPDCSDLIMGPCYRRFDLICGTNQVLYQREGYKLPEDSHVYQGVVCRGNQLGVWCIDPRGKDPQGNPFEIMQNGTGAFAFRKSAWPGFHTDFQGFGGNEVYIMEKFRQRGDRVLCLPGFGWIHQFGRPDGVPYKIDHSNIRNYLTGFASLDRSDLYDATVEHFGKSLPKTTADAKTSVPRPVHWVQG